MRGLRELLRASALPVSAGPRGVEVPLRHWVPSRFLRRIGESEFDPRFELSRNLQAVSLSTPDVDGKHGAIWPPMLPPCGFTGETQSAGGVGIFNAIAFIPGPGGVFVTDVVCQGPASGFFWYFLLVGSTAAFTAGPPLGVTAAQIIWQTAEAGATIGRLGAMVSAVTADAYQIPLDGAGVSRVHSIGFVRSGRVLYIGAGLDNALTKISVRVTEGAPPGEPSQG